MGSLVSDGISDAFTKSKIFEAVDPSNKIEVVEKGVISLIGSQYTSRTFSGVAHDVFEQDVNKHLNTETFNNILVNNFLFIRKK